ncbi:transcriptional regulator swi6 [Mortierella polycephala]|uniref:Transcriptional regulator swi6 n=1 Tax=Mortierella polycephala TaxID=41804 RepID=A0A9P6Q5T3_9FUNG|nr:transcriptional regulator swi6 [Mortierella polycephala]
MPDLYSAVYSGVAVYEVMCRGIAVMRRQLDSYLNATQILKVAGIEKGRRTKILEREVLPGPHEKVQGGYGKYQGTWIPFERGVDLAKQYKVEPLLRALFEYQGGQDENAAPMKEKASKSKDTVKAIKAPATASPRLSPVSKRARSSSSKSINNNNSSSKTQTVIAPSMTPSPLHPSFSATSPSIPPSSSWEPDQPHRKRTRLRSASVNDDLQPQGSSLGRLDEDKAMEEPLEGVEKYRATLMTIFLNDDTVDIPHLLTDKITPVDLDIDMIIDDQGHTALHWAAALARIPVLELLVKKNANVCRVNYNGESALVRAVLVTNNFDAQAFPHLLSLLSQAIPLVDNKNRTLLHHIATTAGIRGRGPSSHYYMECLLEWIAQNEGDFSSIVDIQDKNGDTALTIAARVGDRYLCRFLIDVGANRDLENKVGLKAQDFGIDDLPRASAEQPFVPRTHLAQPPAEHSKDDQNGKRVKEIMTVVQKMVDELDVEFSQEMLARQGQIQDTQALLRHASRELTETRRTIQSYRTQAQQLAEAQQKIKNLEMALEEESRRTRSLRGYHSKLRSTDDIDMVLNARNLSPNTLSSAGVDGPHATEVIQEQRAEHDVISLRSKVYAYQMNDDELSRELEDAQSKTSTNELLCKKVIAICCNIPLDKVDDMLVPLTLAVESDGASLDLSRVAGFMSRVKQQEGMASITAEVPSSP